MPRTLTRSGNRSKSLKSEFIGIAVLCLPGFDDQFPGSLADGGTARVLPKADVLRAHVVQAGAVHGLPAFTRGFLGDGLHGPEDSGLNPRCKKAAESPQPPLF